MSYQTTKDDSDEIEISYTKDDKLPSFWTRLIQGLKYIITG